MSTPTIITSPAHFTELLSANRVVVVDFYADWCGPCRAIAPAYAALASQLTRPGRIAFVKVNTDEQKAIGQTYNVSALPTFVVFKAQREVRRIKGANAKELDAAVRQLAAEASEADASGAGEGSAGSSAGGVSWVSAAPRGYTDVTEQVDVQGLEFLNVDASAGDKRTVFATQAPSAVGGKGKKAEGAKKDWIESDTDEQLMLFVPFQSTLKLHSIYITSAVEGGEDDEAPVKPKTLHLYANRPHILGFDDAEDTPATQTIELSSEDWDPKTHTAKIELRFVKFQNISSLTIFVADGDGESEKTKIDRIRLFGESGEKRAMGKLEKIGDEQGE